MSGVNKCPICRLRLNPKRNREKIYPLNALDGRLGFRWGYRCPRCDWLGDAMLSAYVLIQTPEQLALLSARVPFGSEKSLPFKYTTNDYLNRPAWAACLMRPYLGGMGLGGGAGEIPFWIDNAWLTRGQPHTFLNDVLQESDPDPVRRRAACALLPIVDGSIGRYSGRAQRIPYWRWFRENFCTPPDDLPDVRCFLWQVDGDPSAAFGFNPSYEPETADWRPFRLEDNTLITRCNVMTPDWADWFLSYDVYPARRAFLPNDITTIPF